MIELSIKKKLDYFTIQIETSIDKGILVLQGESGAGKTTILDCIAGLRSPDEGEISVNGKVFFSSEKKIDIPTKDRRVGYVFQNYALFPHMTVFQNIRYGLKGMTPSWRNVMSKKAGMDEKAETDEKMMMDERAEKYEKARIEELLETFHISHIYKKHPAQISGGEKQRVALARALAADPELLLLDEPFSALDVKTKEHVYEEFLEYRDKLALTAVLVTHNQKEAERFGNKIVLLEGHV